MPNYAYQMDHNELNESLSIYLHIPFCKHRCSYCDFNTYTSVGDLQEQYAAALCQEIAQVAGNQKRPVHTIFFGGGTPSLLPATALAQILTAVRTCFQVAEDAEISMEANPGTVQGSYLQDVRQLGLNRISFGVQSAHAQELALLQRTHDFATVVAAVELCRQAGIANFNLDLIYGVPGQTLASWEESVTAVLQLAPTHLSFYSLTIEPGTPMQRWLQNGRMASPDPDLAADQYELACDRLAAAGYLHYEISNWAQPGYECRHNLSYWRNQTYLGLGAGAHGHAAGVRYHVVKQPRVYIRRLQQTDAPGYPLSTAVAAAHKVDKQEAMSDLIITQLRLLEEGLDLAAFARRFGDPLDTVYSDQMSQLLEYGLLQVVNGRLRLTKKGWLLSNQVFYRFM